MALKKWTALLLAALLALSMTACRDEKSVSGFLTEVRTDENGNLTALVLELDGKRTGVLVAEGTSFWPLGEGSWTGEEALEAFRKDLQPGNEFRAWCYPRKEKLETAEGGSIPAYWGQSISISGILKRNALTLRDGTPVDVLESDVWGTRRYRLADGTELLAVETPTKPEDVYVMGQESFGDLSERAQEKVRAYYEEQGLLYDELEELEKSYAACRELGESFACDRIDQRTSPCASSERVMYFLTSLARPQEYGERTCYEWRSTAAFDRETGEKLSNWDLFAASEDHVRRRFPELCGWVKDRSLREAMSAALEADLFVFLPGRVSVSFPPGSLPGEENTYVISLDYEDAPEGFFQPWAIPEDRSE